MPFAFLASSFACNRTQDLGGPSGGVNLTRIEITGPRDIAPNESVSYRATAVYSDGATKDVSAVAVWTTDRQSVLAVGAGGNVTANVLGDATLRATYASQQGLHKIFVVPTGTVRLAGRAYEDTGTGAVNVASVTIEAAIDGAAPVVAQTDFSGFYTLYAPKGSGRLTATKSGYVSSVQSITTTDHTVVDFPLIPSAQRLQLAGTYALALSASPACSADLPAEARARSYVVRVIQRGSLVEGRLEGQFLEDSFVRHNVVWGSVEEDRVTFFLEEDANLEGIYPSVVERLDATQYFVPVGTITTGNQLSGLFDGMLSVRVRNGNGWTIVSSCRASNHSFTMVRASGQ
jgi:hypothetical protein